MILQSESRFDTIMYNENSLAAQMQRSIRMTDAFFEILKEHAERYPEMELQDYAKLAYQSEYGPKHLLTEKQQAVAILKKEMADLPSDTAPGTVEPIGGGLCRFPLSLCKSESDRKTLAELLFLTAQECCGSAEGIRNKTEQLRKLKISGMEEWLKDWSEKGFPPVHHSESYKNAHHPHYRVIKRAYAGYFPAITAVRQLLEQGEPVILGIDGRCGSGKTNLADIFGRLFDCNVFHMDDFYLPSEKRSVVPADLPGGNIDFDRLIQEAIKPARRNQTVIYRPYDCRSGKITGEFRMPSKQLNILEGSYSHHPVLSNVCRHKLFLTCSKKEQKKRLQRREGSRYAVFEEKWIPFEEHYFQCCDVEKNADLTVDTSELFR